MGIRGTIPSGTPPSPRKYLSDRGDNAARLRLPLKPYVHVCGEGADSGWCPLASRPAQCSKCSGNRFCPSVSCRLSRGRRGAGWHFWGRRFSRGGGPRGSQDWARPASRCTPGLQSVPVGTPTRGGTDGSVKAGFDGTEDGTRASTCRTALVWPHTPSLHRRLTPAFHPRLPPAMPVPPLSLLSLAKLRGHPSPATLGIWDDEPSSSLSPLDPFLVSLLWTVKKTLTALLPSGGPTLRAPLQANKALLAGELTPSLWRVGGPPHPHLTAKTVSTRRAHPGFLPNALGRQTVMAQNGGGVWQHRMKFPRGEKSLPSLHRRRAGDRPRHTLTENSQRLPPCFLFQGLLCGVLQSCCFVAQHEAGPSPSLSQLYAQTSGRWPDSGPCLDWSRVDSHLEGPRDLDEQL